MEVHKIPVRFTFDGVFAIKANSKEDAEEHVRKHCGMVLREHCIQTLLPDEDIQWDFPLHPEKTILDCQVI